MKSPSPCSPSRLYLLLFLLFLVNTMGHGVMGFLLRIPGIRPFVRTTTRPVSLPTTRRGASVTGTVYEAVQPDAPVVTLFTKEGCTLCDKVKDVLVDLRESHDHVLRQVDITDEAHSEWFDKYKYDIPVLHLNGKYWLKHRTTIEEASSGLQQAQDGSFKAQAGEPNAKAMEH